MKTTRSAGLLIGLMIIAAACGDDDIGGPGTTAAPGATTTVGSTSQDPPAGEGTNLAIVEVGEYRYEVDVTPGAIQRCDPSFFGAFWAIGFTSDDMGGSFQMLLTPENRDELGMEAPHLSVDDEENGFDWMANPESGLELVEPGMSQIDSFQVSGNTVTGTATFIDRNAVFAAMGGAEMPDPVSGTFQVTCADD